MRNPLEKYLTTEKLSVDEFAARCGLNRYKLYRILNGDQLPRPKDQVTLETAAGIKPQAWGAWGAHLVKNGGDGGSGQGAKSAKASV